MTLHKIAEAHFSNKYSLLLDNRTTGGQDQTCDVNTSRVFLFGCGYKLC
jgi:hypothetical protein